MRRVLLVCACCLVAALHSASGQTSNSETRQGIVGILDPQTGMFHVLPSTVDDAELANATVVVGGTVTVTIAITIKTAALTAFSCNVQVFTADGTTGTNFFTETETVPATGTGTTRTCKVSIPYSWSLATAPTDKMTTSYFVAGSGGTTFFTRRSSSRTPLDTRSVPANGAITNLTAAVTQ